MENKEGTPPGKGPFGLEMGVKKDEYPCPLQELKPGWYKADEVPKPHSAFEYHVLQFSPCSGLSWIKAVGKTITTNDFGTSLQNAFDEMKEKLSKKYGESESFSFLMEGSIWHEPQDWMQGLLNEDRTLAARWKASSQKQLPNQLSCVFLVAEAADTSSGYVAVEYEFENHQIAREEIAALEDDAL